MIRMWSHLTLDSGGLPTAGAHYFDLDFCGINIEISNNMVAQPLRSGLVRVLYDLVPQYPIAGILQPQNTDVDLPSIDDQVYLGPVLYGHHRDHLPLCLFHKNIISGVQKSYVVFLMSCDNFLAAQAPEIDTAPMGLNLVEPLRWLNFNLCITQHGSYTDIDDINTSFWIDRENIGGS